MKNLLTELSILLASFAAAVAALDVFLSDKQKKMLNKLSVIVWYRLAEVNVQRKLELYRSDGFFQTLFKYGASVGVLVVTVINAILAAFSGEHAIAGAIALMGTIIALFWAGFYTFLYSNDEVRDLAFRIHRWVLKGNSSLHLFIKSFLLLIAVIIVWFLFSVLKALFYEAGEVAGFVLTIALGMMTAPFLVGLGVIDMLFIRMLVQGILFLPIAILEYFARRIAEHEKGAVFALSALVGALGVVIETFLI